MKAKRAYLKTKRQLVNSLDGLTGKLLPFLSWGRTLNGHSVRADLMAGLTGAVIVLPQGVAYALIAGLPPVYGIYTAIITPIVAGLFGSSHHLISGPTAAISIIVMSIASSLAETGTQEFVTVVLTLTFLCGLVQFGMGLARLGHMINFISHTVVLGFNRRRIDIDRHQPAQIPVRHPGAQGSQYYRYLDVTVAAVGQYPDIRGVDSRHHHCGHHDHQALPAALAQYAAGHGGRQRCLLAGIR